MKPKGRIFISTSVFNKAYLKRAWAERGALADYERRGFAQFFYLTICGHLESLIAEVIKARLRSIRTMLPWDQLGVMEYTKDGERYSCSLQPLVSSLFALLGSSEETAEQAPFEQLRKLYSKTLSGPWRMQSAQNLPRTSMPSSDFGMYSLTADSYT